LWRFPKGADVKKGGNAGEGMVEGRVAKKRLERSAKRASMANRLEVTKEGRNEDQRKNIVTRNYTRKGTTAGKSEEKKPSCRWDSQNSRSNRGKNLGS